MNSFNSSKSSNCSLYSNNSSNRKLSSSTYTFHSVDSPPSANSTMISQISPIRSNYSTQYANSTLRNSTMNSVRNSTMNSLARNSTRRNMPSSNSMSANSTAYDRNSTRRSVEEMSRLSQSGLSTSRYPAQQSSCGCSSRAIVPRQEMSQAPVLVEEPPSPPRYGGNVQHLMATSPTDEELNALGLGYLSSNSNNYYKSQTYQEYRNARGNLMHMQMDTLQVDGDYAMMSRFAIRKRIKSH